VPTPAMGATPCRAGAPDAAASPPVPHLHFPLAPSNPSIRPIKIPNLLPVRRRPPLWGFFPQIRCRHHQVEEGGSWRKKGGAGGGVEAGGRCGAWAATPCWSHHFAVREGEEGDREKDPEAAHGGG
jgi:hypothetical protein